VAAVAEGCARLAEGFLVAGAIANGIASDRHADLVREGFLRASVPLLGVVRRDPAVALPSRHLGLVQAEEHSDLAKKIGRAGELVAEGCDIDRIVEVGGECPVPSPVAFDDTLSPRERAGARRDLLAPLGQRIAVASDVAFAFLYPHLLMDWRDQGATLSFFSPLADAGPSAEADAVFLPGGYPELHAGRIAAVETFRAGMRAAAQRGALVYGECGGYMVLGESLTDADGTAHRMLGLLPVSTSFKNRKLHLGYRRLRPLNQLPWDVPLTGHEFHFASIAEEGEGARLFEAASADGQQLGEIGLSRGKVMGSFAHVIDARP
jgi:cobyrinic acid a,c-diamide synthase